jgi:hypothetical protein
MSAAMPPRHATEKVPALSSAKAKAAVATAVGVVTTLVVSGVTSEGVVNAVGATVRVLPCF